MDHWYRACGMSSWSKTILCDKSPRIQSHNGLTISIADQEPSHKWLGCRSMVNACTPQGEPARHKASPFWAQAVKRTGLRTLVLHAIYLTSGKRRANLQKVQSSDGSISIPPAMVPNLCIDRNLGFNSPRCAVSFPRIGIGQMDSKQEFFAPDANFQYCLHT